MIAKTPKPPYYVVIFSNLRTDDDENYSDTSDRMLELAAQQPGYLGVEHARDELGITLSYWADLESIRMWKEHSEHVLARNMGRSRWYKQFMTRIARVERDYGFEKET
ncbi:MAG: antibiotic biosynthesis monooxygenase [Bacteroidia bacterium]|nr:antibiotic biosynthesis monooxygenase [Bacteroidia bacterium]